MANEKKTPLELLQAEAADYLDPWNMPAITRAALDAFLVQAFDLGSTAQRELEKDAVPTAPQRCDGMDGHGDRCGRDAGHKGECRH